MSTKGNYHGGKNWQAKTNKTMNSQKEQLVKQVKRELVMVQAAKKLAMDNDLACVVHINGISVALCVNKSILPALNRQEQELKKALEGEPNEWE